MNKALPKARQFLETLVSKTRRLLTLKVLARVFFVAAILGVVAALFAAATWSYSGRSSLLTFLSDLLFLEGTFVLVIGIFIAVFRAWTESEPQADQSTEEDEDDKAPHYSILMIIIGALLIVLSIVAGTVSQFT